MGNCGFTLAPCAKPERHLVVRNLERAEDIAAEAMDAGIEWTWTTFPEFLDRVDSLPKGINYAGYIGHSALRTHVMGERAFEKPAGEDDLRAMERELRDAIRAGAIGFTTSRSPSHETPDRRPVASRLATWDEVRRLVGVMGDMNAGIFELAGERFGGDRQALREYHVRLRDLAVETGRPITWGLFSRRDDAGIWRNYLDLLEETAAAGGRMFAQVHSRALTVVLSFQTSLPFDRLPVWKELRALPLAEQRQRLRDPELRRRLVAAARERAERPPVGAEPRPAVYEWIFVMDTPQGPHRSVADVARERGVDPVEAIIDLALERDLERFFLQPIANEDQDHALEPDEAPPHGGDLLGLRRPRLADHGRLAPDPPAQPLGAGQAGVHARRGGAHAELRARHAVGLRRSRPDPRGDGRRPPRLRSGDDRPGDARGGARPPRGRAPSRAAVARHRRDHRQRRDRPARRQAHRRAARPAAARPPRPEGVTLNR